MGWDGIGCEWIVLNKMGQVGTVLNEIVCGGSGYGNGCNVMGGTGWDGIGCDFNIDHAN